MDPALLFLGALVVIILIFAIFAVKGTRRDGPPGPIPPAPPRIKTPPAKKDFSRGYDPLDDSPLVDPVDLTIDHPEKGKMTFKVNRRNAEKYLKHGPSAFPKRHWNSHSGSQGRYYASSGSGGFDLLDWVIFYHVFLSPNHGHFYEPSTVEARGYFDGTERDFSYRDYNERGLASDPTVSDVPTVHDDQSPHERMENREDGPVITDPFAEEKPSILSDDEVPNASGGSEEHSSHEEVTESSIPSDDQSSTGSEGTSY